MKVHPNQPLQVIFLRGAETSSPPWLLLETQSLWTFTRRSLRNSTVDTGDRDCALSPFGLTVILAVMLPTGLMWMVPRDWTLTQNFIGSVVSK